MITLKRAGAENALKRLNQEFTDYFFICLDSLNIGAIRIVRLDESTCRISPMCVLPDFQGNGYAQQAIRMVETLYPEAELWALETIKQEPKLCHLYEKMDYHPTGEEQNIREGMTLVFYDKTNR